jgi:hypothetical protein
VHQAVCTVAVAVGDIGRLQGNRPRRLFNVTSHTVYLLGAEKGKDRSKWMFHLPVIFICNFQSGRIGVDVQMADGRGASAAKKESLPPEHQHTMHSSVSHHHAFCLNAEGEPI